MTTLAERPRHAARTANTSSFTGTWQMLRLYGKRDRIVAPLWIMLLSLPLASVYINSIDKVYPSLADREQFAASIMASPAQRAFYGQVYGTSLGAVGIWKAGLFHTLIAVAVILTVIRHTRAEEESGRTELVDAGAIGRCASLTAALIFSCGAAIATGLIGTAGLLSTAVPQSGSLAFGLALAGSGLVFAGVAAVAAQLTTSARLARGIAFAVLGLTFTLRAVGDAGVGWPSWLSPQGWSLLVRPYAGERWWILLLHPAAAALLIMLAYLLLARRDVGAGLIAERHGAPTASPALAGPLGLAWRLQRGALVAWAAGLAGYGLLIGSVAHGIGGELGSNPSIRDLVIRMGGAESLEESFISYAFTMLAIAGAAYSISAILRLYSEEAAQREETILAGSVSKIRWATSHLIFAVAGPAVAMAGAGLTAGIAYALAAGEGGKVGPVLAGALVQLPAIWMLAAIALALFGLAPRFTPAVWGILVAFVAIFLLGSVSGAPGWVHNLEPFSHSPKLPGGEFGAGALLMLLSIDTILAAAGLAGLRRRDAR